jgi:hypothetical protein
VRVFVKRLPRTVANVEDMRQLVRASGSTTANHIGPTTRWELGDGLRSRF